MKNDTEVTGDLAIFVADPETIIQRTAVRGKSNVAHRAVVRWIALLALFVLPLAVPSIAQDSVVDCGNGFQCPKGNACLLWGILRRRGRRRTGQHAVEDNARFLL